MSFLKLTKKKLQKIKNSKTGYKIACFFLQCLSIDNLIKTNEIQQLKQQKNHQNIFLNLCLPQDIKFPFLYYFLPYLPTVFRL